MCVAIALAHAGAAANRPAQASVPPAGTEWTVQRPQQRADSQRVNPNLPALTDEHLRTAFADSEARRIVAGVRRARFQAEAELLSYDVRGYQRISMGVSIKALGRERLAYRREGAVRIRWHKDHGANVEVLGARAVVPIVNRPDTDRDAAMEATGDMTYGAIRIPYSPGRESLWFGEGLPDADELAFAHPFARGAEAGYKYSRGDSSQIELPSGKVIRIVELRVVPREPKWFLAVGSFWFEDSTFRAVRAAYRPSVPLEVMEMIDEDDKDDIPLWLRPFMNPFRGTIESVTVEYGLYEGRFWLPRVQEMTAVGQASMFRVPMHFQQRYDYLSVNGAADSTIYAAAAALTISDSIRMLSMGVIPSDSMRDSTLADMSRRRQAGLRDALLTRQVLLQRAQSGDTAAIASLDSLRRLGLAPGCTSDGFRVYRTGSISGRPTVVTRTCNDSLLRNSPYLPPSIFDPTDAAADNESRKALESLLNMGLQAQFAPQLPGLRYGTGDGLLRYNRIEGLSPALGVRQKLGAGLTLDALGRIGTADGEFNAELSASRSNGQRTVTAGMYRRLVASNDFGDPLLLGPSLQALLFGRDEGFYYRARGAEFKVSAQGNPAFEYRLYAERQRRADVAADFSFANTLNSVRFRENIVADHGDVYGATAHLHHSLGDNPDKLRLLTDVKLENGIGDFPFGRGMIDMTVSTGVFGIASTALTLSAGSSTGVLPQQRQFHLGGTQTIRGQAAGAAFGDAFWMGRVELGTAAVAAKPVIFADVGWAGSRKSWRTPGNPLSGVGIGGSFFDGMIRADLAKGINPSNRWRFAMYFEGRF